MPPIEFIDGYYTEDLCCHSQSITSAKGHHRAEECGTPLILEHVTEDQSQRQARTYDAVNIQGY
jgi:hypothetical protein